MARVGVHIFIQNWRNSNASIPEKLRETVANQVTKFRRGRPCCGHPGQPGC